MKQFVMKSWKRVCSLLLVLTLSFSGATLWHAEEVLAADLTETSLTYRDIGYRPSDMLITLEVDEGVTLGSDYWSNSNEIMIDGTLITSSEWYYVKVDDQNLWLLIPYKYFDGATTADEVKAKTHSIVIPKGSSIGSDLKAKEDTAIILNSAGGKQVKQVTLGFQEGYAADNNSQYVITLSGADSSTWGNIWTDRNCVIDGVMCADKFEWADFGDGYLRMVIKYAALESSNPALAEGVGEHEILFPAGTVIGDMVLLSDCRVEVNGYSITKGPDVVLKSSVYSGNAGEMNLVMDQVDDLPTTGWTAKAFTEGGISLNGVLGTNTLTFCKQTKESKLYNVWFNGSSLNPGTIMTIDGKIKEGDYYAKFEKTHFKYTESGWTVYTPTELDITGIYQCNYQESGDQYLIYLETDAEVPGSEGHPYGVTVEINGTSTTQWAQKVEDAEQNLWLLPIPKSAFPEDGTEASVTVKAKKEIMSNQGDNYEIVTVNSDFTFSLQEVLLGDALEDRNLDVKDIVRLKRYLAGETVSVGKGADADENGVINADDRTKMCEYLLKGQTVYKAVTTVQ